MRTAADLRRRWALVGGRRRGWARRLALGTGFVVLAAYPMLSNNGFVLDIATDMALWAVLAIGLNAVLGWTGLLDLGYIAFFALGGYTYAILSTHHVLSFWFSLPIGLAISATAAVIIGIPTLRLKSDYLAIMTLGFGLIVYIAAENLNTLTGGDNGLFGYAAPQIGRLAIDTPFAYYVLALGLTLVAMGVGAWVRASRLGRAWLLVRDDEIAAASVGVPVWRYKLYAYVYGSVWGTLAGALFAVKETIVSPVSFDFTQSFFVVAAVIIGGMGSIAGSVVGGAVYILISEALQGVDASLSGVIFAGAMLGVILLRPRGLLPAGPLLPPGEPRWWRRRRVGGALTRPRDRPLVGPAGRAGARRGPRPALAAAVLEATGVVVDFDGVRAVAGASFTSSAGSVLALIGPNGAGKTTLLNAVSGIAPMTEGRVVLRGADGVIDLTRRGARIRARRRIVRTFQTPRLSRDLTVWENVLQGTFTADRHSASAAEQAVDALEVVGLAGQAEAIAGDLPYGDQRRCEIARALASAPAFLLMDEPSSGMNDSETGAMGEILRRLTRRGLGIVVVEHDMALVRAAADQVVALDLGQVIARGRADAVLADPVVRGRYLGE